MDTAGSEAEERYAPEVRYGDDAEAQNGQRKLSDEEARAIAYDPKEDPMHIDFDESVWIPCIPHLSLTVATVIFAIVAAGVGIGLNVGEVSLNEDWEEIVNFPGMLWVRGLKLLVLPLLVLMMVILPSRVDEIGFIGARAVPLYLLTSTLASIQGTCWAWIIRPGDAGSDPGLDSDTDVPDSLSAVEAVINIFENAVPSNIVVAMYDLTMLGVICFFLVIGVLLRKHTVPQQERDVVLNFSKALLRCCMMAIVWLVWCTPIGMASLVFTKLATTDDLVGLLESLGYYVLAVLVGHSIHVFGVYPAIFWLTTRGNGWSWFLKIWRAPLLAFATSSSAATLPRSLQVADAAGVRKEIYSFIVPLGAAINMDGTAMGFPIMIGLIAQLNEVTMNGSQIFSVLVLAVLVSVGTAPIPNAGMVYLTMIFEAAGLSDYTGEGLAILMVLDWFVDRIETAVNVTSDQFVAKIIDEVSKNSDKKEKNVRCGCCLVSRPEGGPRHDVQAASSDTVS